MSDNCLIIFVKNPELGKVKTRLAHTLGNKKALAIYKKLLQHTHDISVGLTCDKKLYFSDRIEQLEGWTSSFAPKTQSEGDLGQKMKTAFETELSTYQKVGIIGSDCTQLTIKILESAFAQLDHHDAVIGPANDGGYYFLGLNKMLPTLFDDMTWSTSTVLSETINRLKQANSSIHLLPELIDVDTEADWNQVKHGFE